MQRDTTWIHLDLDATDKYIFSYIYILHDMISEIPDNFIILILYIYICACQSWRVLWKWMLRAELPRCHLGISWADHIWTGGDGKTHVWRIRFDGEWWKLNFTGWWFGTWFLFFHILGIIIPNDSHIFQRGRYTTNQFMFDIVWWYGNKSGVGGI